MIYALSNIPITGTATLFSWRTLGSDTDSLASEETLWQGDIPTSPIYDCSLPGIREMTTEEISIIESQNSEAQTQFQTDISSIQTAYSFINGGGKPTLAEVYSYLPPLLRLLLVVATDKQQPL